ncbi:MAG: chaperone NapD [Gammaproteobacteria bacterium]|nr:chaperone NapD [Gammaproteobacteria bacterium]
MSEFNICGVLVHAREENAQQVKNYLENMSGVEVHSATDHGRLIVTVEGNTRRFVADTISSFQTVDGVLSASMVYQYSDDIQVTENSVTQGEMSA